MMTVTCCASPQVAQNNLILTDIITKLGLLDYYDVAWKTSQCDPLQNSVLA